MGTVIVFILLAGAAALSVGSILHNKKNGKSMHCGGNCKNCGGNCR